MADWPRPRSARGFLGLAGYYCKSVKDYGTIAAPLTALLRKEGFSWGEEAENAFNALKTAVTTAPVLGLPDFTKPSVTRPPMDLVLCYSRNNIRSPSSVGWWRHDIAPWRPTNGS